MRERAAPLLPKLIERLKILPDGTTLKGTEFSFWEDLAKLFASLGAPAALALADVTAEGDAKVSRPVTYVLAQGTTIMRSGSGTIAEDEFHSSELTISRFETIAKAFELLSLEAVPAVPRLVKHLEQQTKHPRRTSFAGMQVPSFFPMSRSHCNERQSGAGCCRPPPAPDA